MLQLGSRVTVVNISQEWQADEILLAQVRDKAELLAAHSVKEIIGDGIKVTAVKVSSVVEEQERLLAVDGVFIEVGLIPNTEIFKDLLELNKNGEIITNCACHTLRLGIFAAGDCTAVPEKQIIIAAGEGAKAALSAYRYLKNIPSAE